MGYVTDHVRKLGENSGELAGTVTLVTSFSAQPAGTLLLAFVSTGRKSSITAHTSGWTRIIDQYQYPAGQDHSYHVLGKVADGTETSISVTSNTSSVTAAQRTAVAGVDAITDTAFTGFSDLLQGPTAINNTAVTSYLDSAAMTAETTVNVRIDVVGGNRAVSAEFDTPTPTPSEVVTITNTPGGANRGAFGVFAYSDQVSGGGTSISRRYTTSTNRPESINSFLCVVTPGGWHVGSVKGFS